MRAIRANVIHIDANLQRPREVGGGRHGIANRIYESAAIDAGMESTAVKEPLKWTANAASAALSVAVAITRTVSRCDDIAAVALEISGGALSAEVDVASAVPLRESVAATTLRTKSPVRPMGSAYAGSRSVRPLHWWESSLCG